MVGSWVVGTEGDDDVGIKVGARDGRKVGTWVGRNDGLKDGDEVGGRVGKRDGATVGTKVGRKDGLKDGLKVGVNVGRFVSPNMVGAKVGEEVFVAAAEAWLGPE